MVVDCVDCLERKEDITVNYTPNLTGFLEERLGKGVVVRPARNSTIEELAVLGSSSILIFNLYLEGTSRCVGTVKVEEETPSYDDGYTPIPYSVTARVKIPDAAGRILPWPLQGWATLSYEGKYDYSGDFVEERTDSNLDIPFP